MGCIGLVNRLPVWAWNTRVWGFSMTPPTFDRWLYLWMHRLRNMGSREKLFLEEAVRPGMRVVDVGANIGLYSLLLARLVGEEGRVFSFEPDAIMVAALRRNVAANHMSHVEVYSCAAGSGSGRGVLRRNVMNSGDNRLGAGITRFHGEQASVPVRALQDVLREELVDFIKMDVQGWEAEVLLGAVGLWDANPFLKVYFEFWPAGLRAAGSSVLALQDILDSLGLRVCLPEPGKKGMTIGLEAQEQRMKAEEYTNLLASRE